MTTFDDIPDGEAFPVSATLYKTWRQCPQQALARVQGVYGPPSKASFKGQLAHQIFAKHLEEGPISQEDFTMTCRKEAGASLGMTMSDLHLKPSEFKAIVAQVSDLYQRFSTLPADGFVDSEVFVESVPVEGVTLRGRVDAVFEDDDGVRIVDWKTGAYLEGSEPQLDFYAMMWALANGAAPAALEAISVATGERVVVEPTPQDLSRIESAVADMITEIRAAIAQGRDLERTAGPECRWCPLLNECSEGRSAMEILSS